MTCATEPGIPRSRGGFPVRRPRRLRRSEPIRDLVRETELDPRDFVYPLFVCGGSGVKREIGSMPGQFHFSVDRLVDEVGEARAEGVRAVLLFGR
jgi:porphobilinogen synthase